MNLRWLDLVGTVAVAVVSAVVVIAVPGLSPLRTVFALVLLALPGYALTTALFPERHEIDGPRRLLLSLGLSLSLAVVIALVLNVTPFGVRSVSWAGALLVAVCMACLVAALRRRVGRSEAIVSAILRRRLRVMEIALLLVAACLAAGAVGVARTPLTAKNVQGYTALSLLPGSGGERATVRVGVASGELAPVSYRLVVRRAGTPIVYERRTFELRPGEQLEEAVRIRPATSDRSRPIVALLYREDEPTSVYRRARLWPAQRTAG